MASIQAIENACPHLVPINYMNHALQSLRTRENRIRHLFEQRKWPRDGWSDQTIELLIHQISSLDSNNAVSRGGVGEREGRVFSQLVARRHYGMAHGIGRSGDISEPQPKAVGSSILNSLTNALVLDLIRTHVSKKTVDAFVLPLATGMSISLSLQTMSRKRPKATFVIWSRIDQKSCFKAIHTSGLTPIVVDPVLVGEELRTDVEGIKTAIAKYGVNEILCIITTTSCFAPRAVDRVVEVAQLCSGTPMYHLVNNAYGLQSRKCLNAISCGSGVGRIDVFIQSTDKNLMVPVGGAIVAGFSADLLDEIKKNYPGRASSSQSLDVLITMLSMGSTGYEELLDKRKENFEYLSSQLKEVASQHNEHVLHVEQNNISVGMSLKTLGASTPPTPESITKLGSLLFTRNVHGARVLLPGERKLLESIQFEGWGTHCANYPFPYLTAAATIGMQKSEIDYFIQKLNQSLNEFSKKLNIVRRQPL